MAAARTTGTRYGCEREVHKPTRVDVLTSLKCVARLMVLRQACGAQAGLWLVQVQELADKHADIAPNFGVHPLCVQPPGRPGPRRGAACAC